MPGDTIRTLLLTLSALGCFAANSLLCRAALRSGSIDAASFTVIRIVSGVLMLVPISYSRQGLRRRQMTSQIHSAKVISEVPRAGSWLSASALTAYAGFFSYSYLRIDAGIGALILFGMVQATMIGWGLATRSHPRPLEWVGLLVAVAGLVLLTVPGKSAPDPFGAALMAVAGMAWGIYSLRGSRAAQPLLATAGNFLKAVPVASCLGVLALPAVHVSRNGAWLAVASGAVTSGIGYSLWYGALPLLGNIRAAIVQLAV